MQNILDEQFQQFRTKKLFFRFPELNLTQNFIEENPEDVLSRVSAYDNLITNRLSTTYPCSEISDCTEFSEPWSECSQNNVIFLTIQNELYQN